MPWSSHVDLLGFQGKEIDYKKGVADALQKLAAAHLAKGAAFKLGGQLCPGIPPGFKWKTGGFVSMFYFVPILSNWTTGSDGL